MGAGTTSVRLMANAGGRCSTFIIAVAWARIIPVPKIPVYSLPEFSRTLFDDVKNIFQYILHDPKHVYTWLSSAISYALSADSPSSFFKHVIIWLEHQAVTLSLQASLFR